MTTEILLLLSSGTLGIFLGAQIMEAVLLVPYWKALTADEFFLFHKIYGQVIYRFFAPLTIAATLLPITTICYNMSSPTDHPVLWWLMGVFTVIFFSTYYLYFKKANKRFANESISAEELSAELSKWGNWHWARVCFEAIAFGCSLLLLLVN